MAIRIKQVNGNWGIVEYHAADNLDQESPWRIWQLGITYSVGWKGWLLARLLSKGMLFGIAENYYRRSWRRDVVGYWGSDYGDLQVQDILINGFKVCMVYGKTELRGICTRRGANLTPEVE